MDYFCTFGLVVLDFLCKPESEILTLSSLTLNKLHLNFLYLLSADFVLMSLVMGDKISTRVINPTFSTLVCISVCISGLRSSILRQFAATNTCTICKKWPSSTKPQTERCPTQSARRFRMHFQLIAREVLR